MILGVTQFLAVSTNSSKERNSRKLWFTLILRQVNYHFNKVILAYVSIQYTVSLKRQLRKFLEQCMHSFSQYLLSACSMYCSNPWAFKSKQASTFMKLIFYPSDAITIFFLLDCQLVLQRWCISVLYFTYRNCGWECIEYHFQENANMRSLQPC